MAAATSPSPVLKTAKEIALDPGVLWNICDALLFASVNATAAAAYGASTLVSAFCKGCSENHPAFLQKYPRLQRLIEDPRTPLRAGGITSLFVAGVALAAGSFLPAITSAFFAIAGFKIANSISEAIISEAMGHKTTPASEAPRPGWKEKALKILNHPGIKRPDLYASTGLMLAGLMAGGASLWALPLVTAGFLISTRNALQKKPEYAGYPKIVFGLAAAIFAGVGAATGAGLACAAQIINAFVFVNVESRITPGGFKKISSDIVQQTKSLPQQLAAATKNIFSRNTAENNNTAAPPAPQTDQDAPQSTLTQYKLPGFKKDGDNNKQLPPGNAPLTPKPDAPSP